MAWLYPIACSPYIQLFNTLSLPYILCERMATRSGGSLPFHSSNICSNFSMGPQPLGPMVQGLSTISNTCFLLNCRLIVWLFDCCMIWWFYCLLDWLFWLCGPGALGAPGPKLEDMRGECKYLLSDDYLLSGKQRQSGMHPTAPYTPTQQTAYFAHNLFRIHAPKSLIDIRPKSAYIENAFWAKRAMS